MITKKLHNIQFFLLLTNKNKSTIINTQTVETMNLVEMSIFFVNISIDIIKNSFNKIIKQIIPAYP